MITAVHYYNKRLISGTIDGHVILPTLEKKCHSSSVRALASVGDHVLTASSDKSWTLLNNSNKTILKGFCNDSISSVCRVSEHTFTTGDDAGMLKLWDVRVKRSVRKSHVGDYISGSIMVGDTLVVSNYSGQLGVWDLRAKMHLSGHQNDELTCVLHAPDKKKVLVGTSIGVVLVFSVGQWDDCSDRLVGNTTPVTSIVHEKNDYYMSDEDGKIKRISVAPYAILETVGESPLPIEQLVAGDGVLYSCGHQDTVQQWPVKQGQVSTYDFFAGLD